MTPDTRNYFGQQEVNMSQPPYQFSHGSSGGFSSPASFGEEREPVPKSVQPEKYDKWTNEQQKY